MERKVIMTEDGSSSISIPGWNVTYHSIHGAVRESMHVFIEAGFKIVWKDLHDPVIDVLEMGFGTGLNAFLTAIEAEKIKATVHYTSIEKFPVSVEQVQQLNYPEMLGHSELFKKIHECNWDEYATISNQFILEKRRADLIGYSTPQQFNLVYYDAFAPNAQPELWTKEIFQKLFGLLKPNGILVTYCSKGDVRRALTASGFDVKKLPGPPGKREMLRATKY